MGPFWHLLVGGPASVKTLYLANWDQVDVEQVEFFGVNLIKNRALFLQTFLCLFLFLLELVSSFSVILWPILHLLVGGYASAKTLYLDSWDWIDVEQAEFLRVDSFKNRALFLQTSLYLFLFLLELVSSFSVVLWPILHLLVGGSASAKTLYLDSWD